MAVVNHEKPITVGKRKVLAYNTWHLVEQTCDAKNNKVTQTRGEKGQHGTGGPANAGRCTQLYSISS